MFERVVSNSYYEIAIDPAKNRIYLTIKGFWQTKDLVPHYVEDIGSAVARLKPGFTVLADLTRMVPPTHEVAVMHKRVRESLMENGLFRAAEIVDNPAVTGMLVEYPAGSKVNRRVFSGIVSAEAWLNGIGQ
jgi:hypothetical protein